MGIIKNNLNARTQLTNSKMWRNLHNSDKWAKLWKREREREG